MRRRLPPPSMTRIDAVFNNDYRWHRQGWQRDYRRRHDSRLTSEGPEDSPSRELARVRAAVGRTLRAVASSAGYTREARSVSTFGVATTPPTTSSGSRRSGSASRVRILRKRQHDPRDTFEGLSPPYLAQNACVNARQAAATLALAPLRRRKSAVTARRDDRQGPDLATMPTRNGRLSPISRRGTGFLLARGVGTRLAARPASGR